MYPVPKRFKFDSAPLADPKAIVCEGSARFTVLTDRCIRMEYGPQGTFEDRATPMVLCRKQPVPRFTVRRSRGVLSIVTGALTLRYDSSMGAFSGESLQITLRVSGKNKTVWKFGDTDDGNLGGTFRTLDGRKGAVKLDPGLMSRTGWSVVDDSEGVVFNDDCWVAPRGAPEGQRDVYFFGYGSDYKGCIREFCSLAGRIPLVPRWAMGNWWSRYWEYTHDELIGLMEDFRRNDVPLSVCIIDMDWHITNNKYTNGWTGYTWNTKLFPQPSETLKTLDKTFGLKVGLNLHPHDGVHPHEDSYEPMAKFLGHDPKKKKPIAFDITDPKYADAYFRFLHHPHEKLGVDFWWMDWQQGQKTSIPGLDPLVMLNHLHFSDLARDGSKRPFIFSRWHGLGNHRYQIGFSGDTIVCWESLAAQPHFTATASNVGYSWWSHDIGGHFWGIEDPELYTRWVQYGVFSPILRLHSSKNRFQLRTPWGNGPEAGAVAGAAMRLRHRLVPYIYSMAAKTHGECLPLIRPMYWEHPDDERAYASVRQYYFGTELIAAPFVSSRDPDTRLSRQVVWFPAGEWYGFFNGERFTGDSWHAVYGTIEDTPVYAKAGAIVPMNADESSNGVANPRRMTLRLFAGAPGEFALYEDDGESNAFEKGAFCTTTITQKFDSKSVAVRIAAPRGDHSALPARRSWILEIVGVVEGCRIKASCGSRTIQTTGSYDSARATQSVELDDCPIGESVSVTLSVSGGAVLDRTDRRAAKLLNQIQRFNVNCNIADSVYTAMLKGRAEAVKALYESVPSLKPSQLRYICENLFDAGLEVITDAAVDSRMLVLWNNGGRGVRYDLRNSFRQTHTGGAVPRFRCVPYSNFSWVRNSDYIADWGPWGLSFDYDGFHRVQAGADGHGPVSVR